LAGKSLSDYLLAEIVEATERPTIEELRVRLASRNSVWASDCMAPFRPDREPTAATRELGFPSALWAPIFSVSAARSAMAIN